MKEVLDVETYLKKMKNQKINYDKVLRKMIKDWGARNERPKVLLHSCCAPCSTASLEFLVEHADVTIFFSNSNIHPKSEYMRRSNEQKVFVEKFNDRTGHTVGFIEDDYRSNVFFKMVKKEGLAEEPEGGLRCAACFDMRLDRSAEVAQERGFDYFGSAITLSKNKNSQLINELGVGVQKNYDSRYLPSDFKKSNGYQRSIEMCNEYNVFRQCYCGCSFAAEKQGIDLRAVNKDAINYLKENNLSLKKEI